MHESSVQPDINARALTCHEPAIGVYAQLRWASLPTFLSLLLSIGCVFGLTSSSQKAHAESQMLTKERSQQDQQSKTLDNTYAETLIRIDILWTLYQILIAFTPGGLSPLAQVSLDATICAAQYHPLGLALTRESISPCTCRRCGIHQRRTC